MSEINADSKSSCEDRPPLLEKMTIELNAKSAPEAKNKPPKDTKTPIKPSKGKSVKPAATNTFAFVPKTTSTPTALPAPKGKIPRKAGSAASTSSDGEVSKRLDRLEALMTTQYEQNEIFKENIMSALSVEQYVDNDENHEYPCQEEQYEDSEDPYYNQFHHMSDEETIPLKDEEDDAQQATNVTGQTEILSEAVCNEIPDKSKSVTEEPPVASGFAVKFAMVTVGDNIDSVVATSLQYMLTNKLAEKPLNEMLDRYDTPGNARNLCVPKVNPQIWDSLKPHSRNVDLKLQKVQKLLIKGTIALAKGTDEPNEDQQNALTSLAAAHYEMNMLRRELIKPGLQEKFSQLCKNTVPVTENLFGNDLSRQIKDIAEVHRATGKVARYGHGRFNPYNRRGRGYQSSSFLGRGGSQNRQQTYRQNNNRSMLSARRGRGRGAAKAPQQ